MTVKLANMAKTRVADNGGLGGGGIAKFLIIWLCSKEIKFLKSLDISIKQR